MGGSSSRFAETDWDKADGKLVSSAETIDNEPPTDSYRVFYLTKLGVSQREYNVSDMDSNVRYRTRAVEGTLAWFDVLGPEQDDFRLRVQVDLSRRYWVVYNYGVPAFQGQMWDETATERSMQRDGWRKPLFRRACITVTWSRYHAVVDLYEREENDNEGELDTTLDDKVDVECTANENKGDSTLNDKNVRTGSNGSVGGETTGNETERHPKLTAEVTASEAQETNDEISRRIFRSTTDTETSISEHQCASEVQVDSKPISGGEDTGERSSSHQANQPDLNQSTLGESIKWAQSKIMESVAAPYRPTNREEGIVTLDRPVLKAEEINSIVGQHQTMLIDKEEARQLKREELLTEAKLAREACGSSPLSEASEDDDILKDLWYEYSFHASQSEDNGSEGELVEAVEADNDSVESIKADNETDAATCSLGLVNVCSDSCLLVSSSENGNGTKEHLLATNTSGDEQPLVSFWSWENSIRVHRMKMHLARGSDLALHVVLAVVTNQLRYERHATLAVAM